MTFNKHCVGLFDCMMGLAWDGPSPRGEDETEVQNGYALQLGLHYSRPSVHVTQGQGLFFNSRIVLGRHKPLHVKLWSTVKWIATSHLVFPPRTSHAHLNSSMQQPRKTSFTYNQSADRTQQTRHEREIIIMPFHLRQMFHLPKNDDKNLRNCPVKMIYFFTRSKDLLDRSMMFDKMRLHYSSTRWWMIMNDEIHGKVHWHIWHILICARVTSVDDAFAHNKYFEDLD